MKKKILVDAFYPDETRIVIYKSKKILDFDFETKSKAQKKGNIYLGKITRVEPSLQAAFVDYGDDKHGFLPFSEIHPDYFHIPSADKKDSDVELEACIEDRLKPILPPLASSSDDEDEDDAAEVVTDNKAVIKETALTDAAPEGETAFERYELVSDDNFENSNKEKNYEDVHRKYKIQEVIKRNQVILVQVIKEERGNKGASLTTMISLAGRFSVLMPNSPGKGGVSRRVADVDERNRLKSITDSLSIPAECSIIIRTAGASKTKGAIKRDYEYLARLWNNIRENTLKSKAPAFIHAEGDLIKRTIRDLFDEATDEIVIQGEEAYKSTRDFLKLISPKQIKSLKPYKEKTPIFCKFNVEEQLAALNSPIATLDSGGYIVINPTEALISVDVNSGKATSERNVEETAVKTNIEAANEIARQIRLRDLSGLIVIDFIDMYEYRNKRSVERALREALYLDRARIQIGSISPFGLLEMSRQRLRSSLIEINSVQCTSCKGKGTIRSPEATAVTILRTIESEMYQGMHEEVSIFAHPQMAVYVLNNKREDIMMLEKRYEIKIFIYQDAEALPDSFALEKVKRKNPKKVQNALSSLEDEELYEGLDEIEEEEIEAVVVEDKTIETVSPNITQVRDNNYSKNYRKKGRGPNPNNNQNSTAPKKHYNQRNRKPRENNVEDSGEKQPLSNANGMPDFGDKKNTGIIKGFLQKILE